jgi:biotin carboxyl carrier protein
MALYYAQLVGRDYGFEVTQSGGVTVVRPFSPEGESGEPLNVDLAPVHCNVETGEGLYSLLANNRSYQLYVERHEEHFRVVLWRHRFEVRVLTEREWRLQKVAPKSAAAAGVMVIPAPMPGLVKAVIAREGDAVTAGTRLVVLEAMKMENDITAPRDGKVAQVHVTPGTVVEGGKPLVTME